MKSAFVTLALIAAAGVGGAAYAQTTTQQPGTAGPGGTAPGGTMPGTTSPGGTMPGGPATGVPTTRPIAGEAAAKAALEAKGYTGVKQLRRDNAGNWSGKAKRNNAEVAVMLDTAGNIREQ